MRGRFFVPAVLLGSFLASTSCRNGGGGGGGGGGGPLPVTYELLGDLKVTNDCDGRLASIPNQVDVWAELVNTSGNVGVYGHDAVRLAPDPASPNNPVKIGTYSLTARWPQSAGTAATWRPAIVLIPGAPQLPTPTPLDLSPWYVCRQIVCPAGTGPCKNVATNPAVPPANAPFPTNRAIEIVCGCN